MTSGKMGQRLRREHHFPTGLMLGIAVAMLIALALVWVITQPQPLATVT